MPSRPKMNASKEAIRQLRAILGAVDHGELEAGSILEKRLLRRVEGAVAALETSLKRPKPKK